MPLNSNHEFKSSKTLTLILSWTVYNKNDAKIIYLINSHLELFVSSQMLHITYIEDKFLQNIDLIVFFQQKAIVKVVKVVFQSIKNCESMSYDMSKKFHILI